MTQADIFNEQQAAFWNGAMGRTWVETQEISDQMLAPAADYLFAEARALAPRTVLDIGCGNGTTTRGIADALPDADEVTGIDISEPMMGHAQALSDASGNKASFVAADAASHPYAEEHYDLIVSRFGSMFFGDQIAALRHLRSATAPGGSLCFVVWREPEANTFLTEAAKAAKGLLPETPPRPEDAPSPFAMADEAKMTERLTANGWTKIRFEPVTFKFGFPEKYLETFMRTIAPIGPGLDDLSENAREAVFDKVREAFGAYISESRLEYDAACLVIRAKATG
ncbi:MAG: methyltransferase domain-containing protein [Pseudomonadota bacterium]